MPLKQKNRIRAYLTLQAVQTTGSTAVLESLGIRAGEKFIVRKTKAGVALKKA
jgi:hypothetical protein